MLLEEFTDYRALMCRQLQVLLDLEPETSDESILSTWHALKPLSLELLLRFWKVADRLQGTHDYVIGGAHSKQLKTWRVTDAGLH